MKETLTGYWRRSRWNWCDWRDWCDWGDCDVSMQSVDGETELTWLTLRSVGMARAAPCGTPVGLV